MALNVLSDTEVEATSHPVKDVMNNLFSGELLSSKVKLLEEKVKSDSTIFSHTTLRMLHQCWELDSLQP
jgi:hypothetical protein